MYKGSECQSVLYRVSFNKLLQITNIPCFFFVMFSLEVYYVLLKFKIRFNKVLHLYVINYDSNAVDVLFHFEVNFIVVNI